MIVHQVYALVSEERIQNVCVCDNYEIANHIARASYGDNAFAVDCLRYPCAIGDAYRDGTFYHVNSETGEETAIEYVPTQEEQVQELTIKLAIAEAQNLDTALAVAELGILVTGGE